MALYIPGTTPQDQLMTFLLRKVNLDDKDQMYIRALMRDIEEGSIQNYLDRVKPELKQLSFAKKQEQMEGAAELDREQELKWLDQQRNG